MRKVKTLVTGFIWASALVVTPAFADIPPIDSCLEADEGKACDNAGTSGDESGACQRDMCTRQTPSGSMTYECFVCKAGAAPSEGGGEEKDDGCSISGAPPAGLAGLLAPLAALGLWAARRRRSPR